MTADRVFSRVKSTSPTRGGVPSPVMERPRFICLMYHYLSERPTSRYGVTFGAFRRQLAWLRAEGFTIDGFPELRRRLVSGQVPDRYVVVTFDDGHRSCLHAAECVREAGGQASFFLTKQYCESRPNFLDPAEIRMLASLCSVGSHGVTHDPLSRIPTAQLIEELRVSKRWLEDLVGSTIDTLAAPGGFINSHVIRHAAAVGYDLIGNSIEWWNQPGRVAVSGVVNRVPMRDSFGSPAFASIVRGRRRFYLYRRLRSGLLAPPKRLLPRSLVQRLFGGRNSPQA